MKIQSITPFQVNNSKKQQNFTSLYITPKGMAKLSKMFVDSPETEIQFNKYIAGPLKNLKTPVLFDGFTAEVRIDANAQTYRHLYPCPPFAKVNSSRCGYRDDGWEKEIELASEIMPKIEKGKESMDDFLMLSELEQARCIAEHFELKNGGKLNRAEIKPVRDKNFKTYMKELYSKYNGTFKELTEETIEDLQKWAYDGV